MASRTGSIRCQHEWILTVEIQDTARIQVCRRCDEERVINSRGFVIEDGGALLAAYGRESRRRNPVVQAAQTLLGGARSRTDHTHARPITDALGENHQDRIEAKLNTLILALGQTVDIRGVPEFEELLSQLKGKKTE